MEQRERYWQTYLADSVGMLVRSSYNDKDGKYPLYSDIFQKKNTDNRTAEQIKSDIVKKLLEGTENESAGVSITDNR